MSELGLSGGALAHEGINETIVGRRDASYLLDIVPDFPLGQKGIKGLLVLRGTAGFVGLFGLYCRYRFFSTLFA